MLIGYSEDAKVEIDRLRGEGVVSRPCKISKPGALMCRLLALFTREGGVAVDIGSPAAELASHAVMLKRRAVYVELPGDDDGREGLRLPRLEFAGQGRHPLPAGVLFSSLSSELPEGRGYLVGSSPKELDASVKVCQFKFGSDFAAVDQAAGSVLVNYSQYPPSSDSFFRALASVEGLVAELSPTADCFARSWDEQLLAAYLPPAVVMDEVELERIQDLHRAHLKIPSGKLRIYYHRGHDDLSRVCGGQVELRRLPFAIQVVRGGL